MALGFIVGAVGYRFVKKIQNEEVNPWNALGWGVVGAGVALVPDLFEPAITPLHRGIVHSVTTVGVVTIVTKTAWDSPDLNGEQTAAVASMYGALISHLIADSATPVGLPLI